MLYHMHEAQRLAMQPIRLWTRMAKMGLNNPFNPIAYTPYGRHMASLGEVFEHMTQRYDKPDWGIDSTTIDGRAVKVREETVIHRTYCHLLHFRRQTRREDPRLLIVAPLSGHYATLLRGTVQTLLPNHDIYITDWQDCRMIPVSADRFNLNDYVDYLVGFLHYLGPNTHVMAVCQPSVPVMAAVSIMSGWGDLCTPPSMTLIGGPIDTRKNPTAVNELATAHPIEWFEKNVITTVPFPYPGVTREVYPGFLQLTNFISMNLDRHMDSLGQLFDHLVAGDDEEADKKKAFYEEYLAVMDLPAEFYLQTVKEVFQEHALPRGKLVVRWHPVRPEAITRTAILCIEGELDDISGVGQTKAALDLTPYLPDTMKHYHLQKGAGHYGVFNGGKFRTTIAPLISEFILRHDHELGEAAAANKRKIA